METSEEIQSTVSSMDLLKMAFRKHSNGILRSEDFIYVFDIQRDVMVQRGDIDEETAERIAPEAFVETIRTMGKDPETDWQIGFRSNSDLDDLITATSAFYQDIVLNLTNPEGGTNG
jgi:hypothetical protein